MPKSRLLQCLVIMLAFLLCLLALQVSLSEAGATEDSWMSKAPMREARSHLGVAMVNGKIYAIGGYLGGYNHSSTNEEYDPIKDFWTFKASMPTARANFAVAVCQNKIFCIGGSSFSEVESITYGVNEVYDPATDTWETKAPMPTPREGVEANVIGGRIYVVGRGANMTEVYDPATDTWMTKAPMLVTPSMSGGWTCASIEIDGKIHVIGAFPLKNSHQVYNPESDSWSFGTPVVSAAYYFAVAGVTTGVNAPRRIYVFGADRDLWSLVLPTFISQSYDPRTNSWTVCASMPTGRINAGVAVVDDKLYVIGGGTTGLANADYVSAVNEQYTPIGYGTPDPSYMPPTDRTAPEIAVLSPENKTYNTTDIPLTFTVDESGSWMRYKLDAKTVGEIAGNTTLTGLTYGAHNLTVYATDAAGNTGASQTIDFTVAESPQPFPTTWVAAAVGSIAVISAGLLVYFKKVRKKGLQTTPSS